MLRFQTLAPSSRKGDEVPDPSEMEESESRPVRGTLRRSAHPLATSTRNSQPNRKYVNETVKVRNDMRSSAREETRTWSAEVRASPLRRRTRRETLTPSRSHGAVDDLFGRK